jgi:hypothetical protein
LKEGKYDDLVKSHQDDGFVKNLTAERAEIAEVYWFQNTKPQSVGGMADPAAPDY